MGLIKHSAWALQPADYCSLDQSRPDWPPPKTRRCHDHRLPQQANAREEVEVEEEKEEEELDGTYSSSLAMCSGYKAEGWAALSQHSNEGVVRKWSENFAFTS